MMNKLKAARDLDDEIQEVYNKHNSVLKNDFLDSYGVRINHEDLVINLLEYILEPSCEKFDGDISYFVYDLNFGREYEDGMVVETDQDGNKHNVDFSCAENLYEYLVGKLVKDEDEQEAKEKEE